MKSSAARSSLGFKVIVPMFAIAGLSMGNQKCEETPVAARNLKMNVEIGTLKGRQVRMPSGEVVDFPYVANSLFYRQVINHDHFVLTNEPPTALGLAASKGVFKTHSTKASASAEAAPSGLVSAKDISVLDKYNLLRKTRAQAAEIMSGRLTTKEAVEGKSEALAVEVLPACLYEMPQATIGGEIISFEATYGVGVGIGYNNGGDLGANVGGHVDFSSSKLELGLRADDPLLQQVIAIGDGVSRQSNVKFGIDVLSSLLGLDFFYKTPITDVIRNGMNDGLNQIVTAIQNQKAPGKTWNDAWEARVLYDPELTNGDTHIAFNAGSRSAIQIGDEFTISNMHYKWEGAACYTRLKYSIPSRPTPIASIKVVSVGDNVAVGKVTYLIEETIKPGAQVKLSKLNQPEPAKK